MEGPTLLIVVIAVAVCQAREPQLQEGGLVQAGQQAIFALLETGGKPIKWDAG